jgi:hypothetical protein
LRNLITILTITILFLLSSCGIEETKFKKQKWNEQVDGFYKNRENMSNDLLENNLNKGMKYKNLIELIGKPENYANLENNIIAYTLMENYGWNIDPIETKILKIELSKDSLVESYKIEHWKN